MKNNKKKIAIISPSDRYNYGDLLFPIIITAYINNFYSNSEAQVFSTKKSNLSKHGALKTKRIIDLEEFSPDIAIIAGGEVLSADWAGTYLNISRNFITGFINRIVLKILGAVKYDALIRLMFGRDQGLPWILVFRKYIPYFVGYYGVGGVDFTGIDERKIHIIKSNLLKSNYIAVRDFKTKKNLTEIGITKTIVVPDIAFTLSKIYPVNFLNDTASKRVKAILSKLDSYIVFQVGYNYAHGMEKHIAQQLYEVAKITGKNILLLPIGTSYMHRDHKALANIRRYYRRKKLINKISFCYIPNPTISETMCLIANSSMFMGTSLHGAITAVTYQKPFMMIGNITKIRESMWLHSDIPSIKNIGNFDYAIKAKEVIDLYIANNNTQVNISKKYSRLSDNGIKTIIKFMNESDTNGMHLIP